MMRTFASRTLGLVLLGWLASPAAAADKVPTAKAEYFEKYVRPLLLEKCVSCHGAEKQRGYLRLDSLPGMLAGGESGTANKSRRRRRRSSPSRTSPR